MWLQNKGIFYLLSGVVVVLLLTLSLLAFEVLPPFYLLADVAIFASLLMGLIYLVLNILKFGNFRLVPLSVRLVIYLLLGVFSLSVLLFANFLSEKYLFDADVHSSFMSFLSFKASFAVLVFIIFFQKYHREDKKDEVKDEDYQDVQDETEEMVVQPEFQERITVKSGTKIHVIPLSEVICLLADGDYVHVITEKGKFLKEQTMKYFVQHLPESDFVRVHRSCIVHVSAISRIELYKKQNFQLVLKNGEKVKVSQAGYKLLQEKLGM